jgi:nicotinate-nucleotide pyrophosphorylase (carboxylating)
MFLPREILKKKLLKMLSEDLGQGDLTASLVVPSKLTVEAEIVSKEGGLAAGIEEATILLESLGLGVEPSVSDGEKLRSNQVVMKISGDARTILAVERTVLNVLSRMAGIATATANGARKIRAAGVKTKIACTRKTAPGLLYFDKKAVLIGGGDTHRLHLDDMILIKDNHIAVVGSVAEALKKAKASASFSKKIEVEVTKAEQAMDAVEAGADIVMLDNFVPKEIERTVRMLKKKNLRRKILLEASGGITTENVVEFASTGVDIVSLGELTQNAKALDMSLEIRGVKKT